MFFPHITAKEALQSPRHLFWQSGAKELVLGLAKQPAAFPRAALADAEQQVDIAGRGAWRRGGPAGRMLQTLSPKSCVHPQVFVGSREELVPVHPRQGGCSAMEGSRISPLPAHGNELQCPAGDNHD